MRYILIFLLLLSLSLNAQKSIIREVDRPVTTYPYSDPNPVPRPGRVYPYFRYDGFTNISVIKNWKMVELENDYIKLAITPEIGGKVWEAYEKSQHYPFVFTTSAIKFRDISLRGPWTTGGLEFNFGDIGHATTCFAPVDYFIRNNPDGSVSCFTGATEWASRTTWRVEIRLEPDKAYFTTRCWWSNNTPVEQEYYHWINAGFKAEGDLEFVFPGTHYIGHGGEFNTWPLDSMDREINFYEHNDFGSYKSYHIIGRTSGFYGGYWHNDNMGFGHITPYYEKLGKKVWVLGLSQEGDRWENLLGDNNGLNVELQSGRLFNQASEGSMFTPFKHVGFEPYASDTWTDHWFPVKHTRGMTNATPHGALNLRSEDNWLKIDFMSLENQHDTLKVLSGEDVVISKYIVSVPLEVYRDSVKWNGNTENLIVKLGNDVLTGDYAEPVSRPIESPADFDWESEYGLFLRGSDLSKQKNYVEAEVYLMRAIGKNPNLAPALTKMAEIHYRQGEYNKALEFAGKALAVNTYDPGANFLWGLSNEKAGNLSDAFDGYSVAALSPETRLAAWLRIAGLAIGRSNWNEVAKVTGKCLDAYPRNELAWNMMAMVQRKLGNIAAALDLLDKQLLDDPLNHMARFERYLNTGEEKNKKEFTDLIRQELPHETFIELALRYNEWNLDEEALQILDLAPVHPMVHLWQAYLLGKAGKLSFSEEKLSQAAAASPELVFPFRPEMISMLSWADQQKSDWKWKYYEALIHWQNNEIVLAKSLFDACGTEPDFIPFYLAKADLFSDDPEIAGESLEKAYFMDPANWRSGLELAKFYNMEKKPDQALMISEKNYKSHSGSFIVGLQYAQMLRINKQYLKALEIINKLEMLPAEGDVNAHSLFRETHILYALEQMKSKSWKKALLSLQKAETWPENLFSGEPYLADNRITQLMTAYCYENLKDQRSADKSFTYLGSYKNPDGWTSHMGNEVTRLVLSGERNFKIITGSLLMESVSDRDKDVMTEFHSIL